MLTVNYRLDIHRRKWYNLNPTVVTTLVSLAVRNKMGGDDGNMKFPIVDGFKISAPDVTHTKITFPPHVVIFIKQPRDTEHCLGIAIDREPNAVLDVAFDSIVLVCILT